MAKPDKTRNFGMFRGAMETQAKDALFGTSVDFPKLVEIDLGRIARNPDQPRKHFDPDEMEALAESIQRYGLKQPILVQETGGGAFALVAGERRYRAHEMLGKDTIFAIITSGDSDELALVENVQRVDLDAVELAMALARLMERHGYTQEELGGIIGKSQSYVSHTLRLNALPDAIKQEYATSHRDVSRSVLVEIAWVKDEAEQLALWQRVKAGEGTVKAARTRKARTPASETNTLATFFNAVRLIRRQATDVEAHRGRLDDEQRSELRELRRQIDELLGE
ncbi:ParB/RepB/Spo0J family partition protein [Azospirillum sp.]|uniref:ParB/RepB/Spo0J family partition protein n=1 Tax=Azospirillum sp. TaxID=34012 RepID=UPI003D721BDC